MPHLCLIHLAIIVMIDRFPFTEYVKIAHHIQELSMTLIMMNLLVQLIHVKEVMLHNQMEPVNLRTTHTTTIRMT